MQFLSFRPLLGFCLCLSVWFSACQAPTVPPDTTVTSPVLVPETADGQNVPTSSYLSAKALADFPRQAATVANTARPESPFDSIVFDRVVAYDYNDNRRPFRSIWDAEARRFVGTVLQQKALDADQTQQLINLLTSPASYGHGTAACFDPRLAFIFYKEEEKVMVVDICLDCNYLQSSIKIPAQWEKMKDLGEGFSYPLKGFSKTAQQAIVALCKSLDFYYGGIDAEALRIF